MPTPWHNPFRPADTGERRPESLTMVIFGASGDLAHRKLLPALATLSSLDQLPEPMAIIGYARRPWSDDEFRERIRASVLGAGGRAGDPPQAESLASVASFISADLADPVGYQTLKKRLDALAADDGPGRNRLFYLATPPSMYGQVIAELGRAGLARSPHGWTRIIVEKPFGHDLATAGELNRLLLSVFDESQIYRIDHYLGKETVQNLLVFRFGNGIFEPLWNQRYIDHVQITVAETVGMEGRGAYFEEAGILRDIFQNHILQLISLFAMEPPASFSPEAVRDEKVKVLQSLRPLSVEDVASATVRGQYGPGFVEGREVTGYRLEEHVAAHSMVETYVAARILIDNWRWAGVPFYIRTGKRLAKRETLLVIQYQAAPHHLFGKTAGSLEPNVLTLRIQPDEGISLSFSSKVPGSRLAIRPVKMDFRYGTAFGAAIPDAYVRLLLDSFTGDATLFARRDEIEAAWAFTDPILDAWRDLPCPLFPNYAAGTWGPPASDGMIVAGGRAWRQI